ncbi:hypothetical protein OpiT1DRAFT_01742 [Opitutaceae bacterium TAV1]|nr:hypothetical protein OpiT1DRAFT_01742 [Opitutaceae bacterium TAV1]
MPSSALNPADEEVFSSLLPRQSRARLLWLLGGCAALVLAMLALVMFSDADPPDVSDLAFTPRQVPDEANFYLAALRWAAPVRRERIFTNDLYATYGKTSGDPGTVAYSYSGEWEEALARGCGWTPALCEKLRPQLVPLAEAFLPLANMTEAGPVDDDAVPGSWRFYQGASLLPLAAFLEYAEGHRAEALAILTAELRAAQLLMDGGLPLVGYWSGTHFYRVAANACAGLASRADADATFVRAMLQAVAALPVGRDSYEESLLQEAAVQLPKFRKSPEDAFDHILKGQPLPDIVRMSFRIPMCYKRNLTAGGYAAQVRAASSVREATLGDIRTTLPEGGYYPFSSLRDFHPYNLNGRYLLNQTGTGLRHVAQARLLHFSRQSALRAFLAARLYEREHGELPASLDVLVPDYLPEVPFDYIDRQPIRYDRELRAVWSLGLRGLVTPPAMPGKNEAYSNVVVYRFAPLEPAAGDAAQDAQDIAPAPLPAR